MVEYLNDWEELFSSQLVETLRRTAGAAYEERRLAHAAGLFGQAQELAEAQGDVNNAFYFNYRKGVAILEAGKLREALGIFASALQRNTSGCDDAHVYGTLTRYIDVAQELPISLATIEQAHERTENFLRHVAHVEWRSRLVLMRARLLVARGLYDQALIAAQESLAVRQDEWPTFAFDAYYDHLVGIALHIQNDELATQYLSDWAMKPNSKPKARDILWSSHKSDLCRLQGKLFEALEWARRANVMAQQSDDDGDRFHSACSLTRAYLAIGWAEEARNVLFSLLPLLKAERNNYRYVVYQMIGDYHLCCVRLCLGLAPVDEEFGTTGSSLSSASSNYDKEHEISLAELAYKAAMRLGGWIDDQLECTVRRDQIALRQKHLAELRVT